MPKIFTKTPGAVIRIGGHGMATNEKGVAVPLDIAGELAGRPDLRVEWDSPGQEVEARGAHRQRIIGDLDRLLKVAAPRPDPKPKPEPEPKPRRFVGKDSAAPDKTAENEE